MKEKPSFQRLQVINAQANYSSIDYRYVRFNTELLLATLIRMGGMSKPDQLAHTLGAVICTAGVGFDKKKGMYLFHSFGLELPSELVTLLQQGEIVEGIAGGSIETFELPGNRKLFERSGFSFVPRPESELDAFKILSVPNEGKVFYAYESSKIR